MRYDDEIGEERGFGPHDDESQQPGGALHEGQSAQRGYRGHHGRGGRGPREGQEGPGGPDGFGPGGRRGHHGTGFGQGFGPRGSPGSGPGGRRGRRPRGDVRNAILLLLAEQPMHGYQLMEAIAERSGGRWRPSPGAVYPTLNLLEDEGVITLTQSAGRRLAELTEEGRALVDREASAWPDPFAAEDGDRGVDLRHELGQLQDAVRAVARGGTEGQRERAGAILAEARRSVYLLLAGEDPQRTDPQQPADGASDPDSPTA